MRRGSRAVVSGSRHQSVAGPEGGSRSARETPMPRALSQRQAGFTMLEILVVLAILGILALFTMPMLQRMIIRSQLEAMGRETVTFLRSARLEAIKNSAPVVVNLNTATGEVSAFADINDALGNPGIDLLYNPQGGAPPGTTDYIVVPTQTLTKNASFGGPAGDAAAVTGFAGIAPNYSIVFNADGTVSSEGTLRFGDTRENYLQVAVGPRTTARVRILKWDRDDSIWHPRARETGGVTWEWYL